jgi:hypothetical protein
MPSILWNRTTMINLFTETMLLTTTIHAVLASRHDGLAIIFFHIRTKNSSIKFFKFVFVFYILIEVSAFFSKAFELLINLLRNLIVFINQS